MTRLGLPPSARSRTHLAGGIAARASLRPSPAHWVLPRNDGEKPRSPLTRSVRPHEMTMIAQQSPAPQTGLLTVVLEDYYQVGAFNHVITLGKWERFENRLSHNTKTALDLLDR